MSDPTLLSSTVETPILDLNCVSDVPNYILRQGCLVILFTNFLALVIKAGVASKDSSGSAAYSVVLIVVNVMFFLSIWWNAWTTAKATFSRSHAQVRARIAPRVAHAVQQDKVSETRQFGLHTTDSTALSPLFSHTL